MIGHAAIRAVTAYVLKAPDPYVMSGSVTAGTPLPGSDYLRFEPHRQLYSRSAQAALVKVETHDGAVGWGEAQVPVGSEIVLTIIRELLGPAVLGRDATNVTALNLDMYETNRVRGHIGSYQQDAIAAIDTALWDIRGRLAGLSIAELLGGRLRDDLPLYVTGLREKTLESRRQEAAAWAAKGFGIKPCLGGDARADAEEIAGLRDAVGPSCFLALDALWGYSLREARLVGRVLDECGVDFFEAPLSPEDLDGHRRLRDALDVPVAIGEGLRTRHQFLPWLVHDALEIAQPDLMRNGVSETAAICTLASSFQRPVALHCGVVTPVGMAATWQLAATLPSFLIQEFQPVMHPVFGGLTTAPLQVGDGVAAVPTGPGLGIEVDEAAVESMASASITVEL